jgi:ribosomal protein S27E
MALKTKTRRKFSKATDNGACPKCGGVAFRAKRSLGGKLLMGLFARKKRVQCQGCGYEMRRG